MILYCYTLMFLNLVLFILQTSYLSLTSDHRDHNVLVSTLTSFGQSNYILLDLCPSDNPFNEDVWFLREF